MPLRSSFQPGAAYLAAILFNIHPLKGMAHLLVRFKMESGREVVADDIQRFMENYRGSYSTLAMNRCVGDDVF